MKTQKKYNSPRDGKHKIDIEKIQELSEWLYANPDKRTSDCVAYFTKKYNKAQCVIYTLVGHARRMMQERVIEAEKKKTAIIIKESEKEVLKSILSRNEACEILSNIAKGKVRKVGEKIIIPTDNERTRAITVLSDVFGWNAPAKIAQTDTQGNDIIQPSIKLSDGTLFII